MYLYWAATEAISRVGRYGTAIGLVMIAIQAFVFFGPPPASDHAAAITALASYFGFAAIVYWLERKRVPRAALPEVLS